MLGNQNQKGSDFVPTKIRTFWFGFRTLKTYSVPYMKYKPWTVYIPWIRHIYDVQNKNRGIYPKFYKITKNYCKKVELKNGTLSNQGLQCFDSLLS